MRIPGLATLGSALGSMAEKPFRTFLTMFGIIAGVASVFFVLSIGQGAQKQILENLDTVEARTMSTYPDWNSGRASNRRAYRPFTESDIEQIQNIPGVLAATGELNANYTLVTEINDWEADVRGVDTQYLATHDLFLADGEVINQFHIDRSDTVAVVGQSVVRSLFGGQYPIGQRIKIQNIPFTVIGIAGQTEAQGWRGQDENNFVLIPRTTLRARLYGDHALARQQVRGATIVGETQDDLSRIEREVDYILRQSRGLSPTEAPDFRIFNFSANRQSANQTRRILSFVFAGIGAVVLLVAGVGVMNIMLVSVSERTREIGLRIAIGARRGDIMTLFLTEALLITSLSGLLGLAIGYAASKVSLGTEEIEMVVSPSVVLLAFGSSVLVGIISGFLPARRAANLNPIEALRHE